MAQKIYPPLRCQDPGSVGQRRIMTDVLTVTAGQYRHPVLNFILLIAHNLAQHERDRPLFLSSFALDKPILNFIII